MTYINCMQGLNEVDARNLLSRIDPKVVEKFNQAVKSIFCMKTVCPDQMEVNIMTDDW